MLSQFFNNACETTVTHGKGNHPTLHGTVEETLGYKIHCTSQFIKFESVFLGMKGGIADLEILAASNPPPLP